MGVEVVAWGESVYDALMAMSLAPLNTYCVSPEKFIRRICAVHWGLTPRATKKVLRRSPAAVVGHRKVAEVLRRRMHLHAMRVMAVTTLCSIGEGWWIYPLILVDVVYFQREVFIFAQESFLLCRPRQEYAKRRFDYAMVAMLVTRVMEPFVFRQVKKVVGLAGSFIFRRGGHFLRGPVKVFMRQLAKWTGLSVAKGAVDGGLEWFVLIVCAVIAGAISYWMFFPMARRAMPQMTGWRARDLFSN